MKDFKYGSVLKVTRYDTSESIRENFLKMKACGMNTVVIWPAAFWWEEKSCDYPFATGKQILKIAEECDIGVIMELAGQLTSMEYVPDFKMKPEYHPINLEGVRERGQSSFGFLNYFHPEVNALVCEHFKKCAEAYKDYKALVAYDIFNETMFRSYDEYTMAEFQNWLKNKYKTIDKLNAVWERTYGDFSQITFENWKWMSIMSEADFYAFRKAAVGIFVKRWYDAVKAVDGEHKIIADNIHSMLHPGCEYYRPQDDFDLQNAVDEIGMSFYPKQVSGTMENALRSEVFDAYYAASRRQGFYISEMQTHIQALYNATTCVRPHELKRWCHEAYSAGLKGLIYWMWRPFDKGLQTMGRGLVDYRGRETERYAFAKEFAKTLDKYGKITPIRAKVGIVFDSLTDDFTRIFGGAYNINQAIHLNSIYGAYKAFFEKNCKCDIITFEELSDYKVVILTNQLVMDGARAAAVKRFVEEGGTVIIDGRFGLVDAESELCRDLPGGEANCLTGVEYLDTDYENTSFSCFGAEVKGSLGRDLTERVGGECIGSFCDGRDAVMRVKRGLGEAITFNTHVWYAYALGEKNGSSELCEKLIAELDLRSIETDGDVIVRVAENETDYVIFVFNYEECDKNVNIKFTINGKTYKNQISVKANDSVIYSLGK